ncbi:GIY-YIG nuclease family protein, partial [Idiomarina sp.]
MAWSVYLVKCADNTFYTGVTTDVERRVNEHNVDDKKGAK